VGCDGWYKIGRLGACYFFPSELISKEEKIEFLNEFFYWNKADIRPPEFSTASNFTLTVAIDIWGLGKIVQELINIGTAAKPPIKYSPQLISLVDMMLKPHPRERPTADYILHYITEKESLTGPALARASVGESSLSPEIMQPEPVQAKQTGFLTSIFGQSSTKSTK